MSTDKQGIADFILFILRVNSPKRPTHLQVSASVLSM
jgi:hypothetical protein